MKDINWNKLRDEVHANSVEHGFWEGTPSDKHFLCLVICELMEAVQADRKDSRFESNEVLEEASFGYWFDLCVKGTVEDELADVALRLFDLAGQHNINLNGRICLQNVVSKRKSFTENIYAIVKDLVNYRYSLEEQINYCFMQIQAFAEILNIDLVKHIELKMKYNKNREYKHGKKY